MEIDVLIECALYKGELWSVGELLDENGQYKEDLRLFMRKESQNNQFYCPDCGNLLVLCTGQKLPPFFRHHQKEACEKVIRERGSSFLKARKLLYELARRSFPQAHISSKITANPLEILIEIESSQLVLTYASSDIKYITWEEIHKNYERNNMIDIWVLNAKTVLPNEFSTFQYLVAKTKGQCICLDVYQEKLILKKNYKNRLDQTDMVYAKQYFIDEVTLTTNGEFLCDFEQCYIEHMDNLEKQWESRERQLKDQRELLERIYAAESGKVLRLPLDPNIIEDACHVSIDGIHETWILPELKERSIRSGAQKERMRETAYEKRYLYLIEVNDKLNMAKNEKEKERIIEAAIRRLEHDTRTLAWFQFQRG